MKPQKPHLRLLPVIALPLLVLSACGFGTANADATIHPAPIEPIITFDNAAGEASDKTTVKLNEEVTLSVVDGEFTSVEVTSDRGTELEGEFNDDNTAWVSTATVEAEAEYSVAASAQSPDMEVDFAQSFLTPAPEGSALKVSDVTPNLDGEVLGVGAPIIVTFNQDVPDRGAVERRLEVSSEKGHEGAWRWMSDNQAIYRTAEYWDAYQTVTFSTTWEGQNLGGDLWGGENYSTDLTIGASQLSVIDPSAHTMTVSIDGEVARTFPVSAGKATTTEYTTASGEHMVMAKSATERMISPGRDEDDPEYYDVEVDWAVRINATGEYVHQATASASGVLGQANVSHGCVNASADDAKWFYDIAQRGDVVDVINTDRQMPWDNGWGYWILSFDDWKEGSALT
ncbi:L,D-transpeptidase [Natronoglycomyces albus]|uniref:L,D-transpeptidase family protein n=1 Tax=Natronoglycomyces albus TaxID=2811108 RepID=A0A895XIE9_9ACTN|nr:Ig-like domain-containing protein [Natronoglycomyces albus]QSB04727.1 L,D-transpeptidase family protein [Natronoglycomyces albus]